MPMPLENRRPLHGGSLLYPTELTEWFKTSRGTGKRNGKVFPTTKLPVWMQRKSDAEKKKKKMMVLRKEKKRFYFGGLSDTRGVTAGEKWRNCWAEVALRSVMLGRFKFKSLLKQRKFYINLMSFWRTYRKLKSKYTWQFM